MSRIACFLIALAIAPAAAADPTSAKAGMCAAFKAVEKKARVADALLVTGLQAGVASRRRRPSRVIDMLRP